MSTEEHNNTLLRMVNDTLDTATSTITSQTFRDIANQSDTLQGFKDGMSNLFQKKLGLNEQISKQIVDTFLQDKEIYIYNLYKNTKEMPFVNINLNGTIDLSTENRAAFADKE
jgi:ABC-type phosphate/phosphonate transport system ATPase subunit